MLVASNSFSMQKHLNLLRYDICIISALRSSSWFRASWVPQDTNAAQVGVRRVWQILGPCVKKIPARGQSLWVPQANIKVWMTFWLEHITWGWVDGIPRIPTWRTFASTTISLAKAKESYNTDIEHDKYERDSIYSPLGRAFGCVKGVLK